MANLDAPLVQEILDVAQRERVADIEHHRQTDDFGAGFEVAERARSGHQSKLGGQAGSLKNFALTLPRGEHDSRILL